MNKQGAPYSTQTLKGNPQEEEAGISMTFMRNSSSINSPSFLKENLVGDRTRNFSYREQKKQCSVMHFIRHYLRIWAGLILTWDLSDSNFYRIIDFSSTGTKNDLCCWYFRWCLIIFPSSFMWILKGKSDWCRTGGSSYLWQVRQSRPSVLWLHFTQWIFSSWVLNH